MLGAIIGDTVGSIYEHQNIHSTDFPLFQEDSLPTDDSVMSMAVAEWLLRTDRSQAALEESLIQWGYRYPDIGYGPSFGEWLFSPYIKNMDLLAPHLEQNMDTPLTISGIRRPYNSYGNGSAMRCSACGWLASSLEEALSLAEQSAIITHNHPEGIKGAQSTAACIFLARQGTSKEQIRSFVEQKFAYDLDRTCDDIRPNYAVNASCQGTVPEAIVAFLDSMDFESALRLAISLGGDSDTLACITCAIAEAFYQDIPEYIIREIHSRIAPDWWKIITAVRGKLYSAEIIVI